MLICEGCGHVSDVTETIFGIGGEPDEPWGVCEECGSGNLEDAERCMVCGEYHHPNDMASKFCCNACAHDHNEPKTALEYLTACEAESDFFINYYFNSDGAGRHASTELVDVCRKAWESDLKKNEVLHRYINDNLRDFAEWLEVEKCS